jgi:GcrA cell cycle regulator
VAEGPNWTKEEDALLRSLFADKGLTATQAMEYLPGRTKNSIIGRSHRLGIGSRHVKGYWDAAKGAKLAELRRLYFGANGMTQRQIAAEMKIGVTKVTEGIRRLREGVTQSRKITHNSAPRRSPDVPLPEPRHVDPIPDTAKRLWELERNECKWPYGQENYLFCAAPRAHDDTPYCARHTRIGRAS